MSSKDGVGWGSASQAKAGHRATPGTTEASTQRHVTTGSHRNPVHVTTHNLPDAQKGPSAGEGAPKVYRPGSDCTSVIPRSKCYRKSKHTQDCKPQLIREPENSAASPMQRHRRKTAPVDPGKRGPGGGSLAETLTLSGEQQTRVLTWLSTRTKHLQQEFLLFNECN